MHVKDVMTHCAVTMPKDSTLAEVTRVLLKHHLNGVPIVDSENKLLGIITRAHIFRRILPGYDEICREGTNLDFAQIEERANQAAQLKVDETMSCPVITVDEEVASNFQANSRKIDKQIHWFINLFSRITLSVFYWPDWPLIPTQ